MSLDQDEFSTLGNTGTEGSEQPDSVPGTYLLVFDQSSSWVVSLKENDEVLIGRTPQCQVRLSGDRVSRAHAKITVESGLAMLADLDSHNGTRLNGRNLTTPCPLVSGDVIGVGDVKLTYHAQTSVGSGNKLMGFAALRERLGEELERARTFERNLAVCVIDLGDPATQRKACETNLLRELHALDRAAWLGNRELAIVMPECDVDAAEASTLRILAALSPLVPSARLGLAVYPEHGVDVDMLLGSARRTAQTAEPRHVEVASESVETLRFGEHEILIAEPVMENLYALLSRLAKATLPILIRGETGSGKELAAAAIHHSSPRKAGPFVSLNCAAIMESLAESELFGYRRGAFSGALTDKMGLLEAASGGTLFLDEIGELSLSLQAKVLRVLDVQRLTRVGDTAERRIDLRLVAATHRDLSSAIREGKFREDLFFRLSAATVWIPPLRDRPREIPVLFESFMKRAGAGMDNDPPLLAASALEALRTYAWPGNVRQLKNVAEYFATVGRGSVLDANAVRAYLASGAPHQPLPSDGGAQLPVAPAVANQPSLPSDPARPGFRRIGEELIALERQRMTEALEVANGNQTRAAELLGMSVRTFFSKVKQYGLGRNAAPRA